MESRNTTWSYDTILNGDPSRVDRNIVQPGRDSIAERIVTIRDAYARILISQNLDETCDVRNAAARRWSPLCHTISNLKLLQLVCEGQVGKLKR